MSIGWQIGKENVELHKMEYYSAIKRNKVNPFAETLLDLEIVIQSEVNQKKKNKYYMILLICGV